MRFYLARLLSSMVSRVWKRFSMKVSKSLKFCMLRGFCIAPSYDRTVSGSNFCCIVVLSRKSAGFVSILRFSSSLMHSKVMSCIILRDAALPLALGRCRMFLTYVSTNLLSLLYRLHSRSHASFKFSSVIGRWFVIWLASSFASVFLQHWWLCLGWLIVQTGCGRISMLDNCHRKAVCSIVVIERFFLLNCLPFAFRFWWWRCRFRLASC